jgi:hypothetical protein
VEEVANGWVSKRPWRMKKHGYRNKDRSKVSGGVAGSSLEKPTQGKRDQRDEC